MTKLTLARVLRLFVSLTLLAVISVILWYFVSHRRPRTVVEPAQDTIPSVKVERQEGVEHLDFKGDRVVRATAESHYAGDDGRYYLEGKVEVRDLGKKGDEEVVLTGEKVSYDKDWNEILLEGSAKIRYEGLTVESSSFTYHKAGETLDTDRGVVFSSEKVSGKARQMSYSFKKAALRLEGEVDLELREESEGETPFLLHGDTVTFERKRRRGLVEGNASFSFGQSRGRADSLRFELTPDEQSARRFFLKGNVQTALAESPEAAPDAAEPEREEREVWADEVDIRAFKDRSKIHRVEARGQCLLRSTGPESLTTEVKSGRMRILFDRWGWLKEFWAWEDARLVEQRPGSGVERAISGAEIFIAGRRGAWKIKADEGKEARVDSADSDVTAESFVFYPRRAILDAAGGVKVILKLRPEEAETVGFFSSEQPVFGAAEKMRYETNLGRLNLRGTVRLWQGKEVLSAQELTALKKSGEITATGSVRAIFSRPPKEEKATEEKFEIGGGKLGYGPKERSLTFEEGSWLKSKEVGLNSDRIVVRLREKTAEMLQIDASGKVTFTEELREGKGEMASYDLVQETVVLTGNPTIVDKEKGVVQGEKLTFRLGEGRIQVENKDRERSTTVIKS